MLRPQVFKESQPSAAYFAFSCLCTGTTSAYTTRLTPPVTCNINHNAFSDYLPPSYFITLSNAGIFDSCSSYFYDFIPVHALIVSESGEPIPCLPSWFVAITSVVGLIIILVGQISSFLSMSGQEHDPEHIAPGYSLGQPRVVLSPCPTYIYLRYIN